VSSVFASSTNNFATAATVAPALWKANIRPGYSSRLPAKVTNRMSFRRLKKSIVSEGPLLAFAEDLSALRIRLALALSAAL
jgi:hypothetical protein